jgi:hypothetical protein
VIAVTDARLTGGDARQALEVVTLVAERLADPDEVAKIAGRAGNEEPVSGLSMWSPRTLSNGLPGTAMLFAELARFDPRWRAVAHRHLKQATRERAPHFPGGLHAGPASLLAAAQSCAGPEGHYAGLRRKLAGWLAGDHHDRLSAARERVSEGGRGVGWADYDVIHGLSGTARLLLDSAESPDENSEDLERALTETLRHLVWVSEPAVVDGHEVPGWWVPPELEPVDQDRVDYPRGDFNLGMAHGVAGPLALLALALGRGHEVAGQRDAITRFAEWLISWMMTDDDGPYWPCRVSWDEQVNGMWPASWFTRTAWCYGAPGVAAALHAAGTALGVDHWRATAVGALRSALRRDESRWRLDGPTVCHGYAGLLQVVWRVATASGDPELSHGCHRLARSVLAYADPDLPFVFSHLVPDSPEGWRTATAYKALDGAGVLEGAAGVACALISVIPPSLISGTPGPASTPGLIPGPTGTPRPASTPELAGASRPTGTPGPAGSGGPTRTVEPGGSLGAGTAGPAWDRCLGLS